MRLQTADGCKCETCYIYSTVLIKALGVCPKKFLYYILLQQVVVIVLVDEQDSTLVMTHIR